MQQFGHFKLEGCRRKHCSPPLCSHKKSSGKSPGGYPFPRFFFLTTLFSRTTLPHLITTTTIKRSKESKNYFEWEKKNVSFVKQLRGVCYIYLTYHIYVNCKQAVELLVNCNDPGVLEVNATNKSGLSALDLFILCPCESGSGAETMRLLGRLGAARAQDSNPIAQAAREGIKDLERYFEFRLDRDNPSDVRNALLVVAVLMATATYQAGLEPPGKALLATNPYALAGVMLANSAGFLASMNMIVVLTHNFPFKFELFVAGLAMGVTNGSAMITLAPQGPIRHTFIALSIIMPLAIYICRLVKARIKQHI